MRLLIGGGVACTIAISPSKTHAYTVTAEMFAPRTMSSFCCLPVIFVAIYAILRLHQLWPGVTTCVRVRPHSQRSSKCFLRYGHVCPLRRHPPTPSSFRSPRRYHADAIYHCAAGHYRYASLPSISWFTPMRCGARRFIGMSNENRIR